MSAIRSGSRANRPTPAEPPPVTEEIAMVPLGISRIVTGIFDDILAAVQDGRLQPGQRISDSALAEQLGVSRTPVREALQRLREIGVIEASPNRFTRVAEVSPLQTAQALVVWLALYAAVIDEVVPTASTAIADAMQRDHDECVRFAEAGDFQGLAGANLAFFFHLAAASTNPALVRALTSVVHVIRLGSLHLPERIDIATLTGTQVDLLAAVRARDVAAAHAAMEPLRTLRIPQ